MRGFLEAQPDHVADRYQPEQFGVAHDRQVAEAVLVHDVQRFAELGRQGVLALFADSTNIDRPGFTGSEVEVIGGFEELATLDARRELAELIRAPDGSG